MEEHTQHPPIRTYLLVATVLAVITAVELSVFYITVMAPLLAPALIALSAVKFSLVVMFFMHLRYDSRIFSALFVGPLMIVIPIILALLALFGAAVAVSH